MKTDNYPKGVAEVRDGNALRFMRTITPQLISGQGVPPAIHTEWRPIYPSADGPSLHVIEDKGSLLLNEYWSRPEAIGRWK